MSSILQKQIGIAAGNPSIVGATELVIAYTGRCEVNTPTCRAIIKGWALLQTGTGTTGVVLRIRRGNGITGAVVAGGPVINVAGVLIMDTSIKFAESLVNAEYADYTLTVVQIGASANGTVQYASIEVELING